MADGMRDGLAWRWIGLHAATFLLSDIVRQCVDRFSSPHWISVGLYAMTLVIGLTAAAAITARRHGFPVKPALWGSATLVGMCLGVLASMGMSGLVQQAYATGFAAGLEQVVLVAKVWSLAVETTVGLALGGAQGFVLRGRVRRVWSILWIAAVAAAWLLMGVMTWGILEAAKVAVSEVPLVWLLILWTAGKGALLGVMTLPVLRKILVEPGASAA